MEQSGARRSRWSRWRRKSEGKKERTHVCVGPTHMGEIDRWRGKLRSVGISALGTWSLHVFTKDQTDNGAISRWIWKRRKEGRRTASSGALEAGQVFRRPGGLCLYSDILTCPMTAPSMDTAASRSGRVAVEDGAPVSRTGLIVAWYLKLLPVQRKVGRKTRPQQPNKPWQTFSYPFPLDAFSAVSSLR